MCSKRLYILILLLGSIFPTASHSQKQANNWYFGNYAGLSFASGTPTPLLDGQLNTLEGVATISDTAGNLLFYTDGRKVWNKLHQVMQNGTGLYGDSSSTQSAVIIKQPGNDSIYYIFTADQVAGPNGFCYSIVNIALNNGNGAVTQKNFQLLTPVCEKITAVRHCNRKDIWVITREFGSDRYYSYLLTANGISTPPVISSVGNIISGDVNQAIGYLKASPDGQKLAAANNYGQHYLELMDFNASNGVISNLIKINALIPHVFLPVPRNYGVEFSPNGKLLYLTSRQVPIDGLIFGYLLQFDVTGNDSATISSSIKIVDSVYQDKYTAIQMANNGKMYVARLDHAQISVINNPDGAGLSCNFARDAVDLGGRIAQYGLPTFFQSYFYELGQGNITTTGNCSSTNVQFNFNRLDLVDSVRWNFNDPASGINNTSTLYNPSHLFSNPGAYTVQLLAYRKDPTACSFSVDTIYTSIYAGQVKANLGNDTSFCKNDTLELSHSLPGASYLWSTGETGASIKISQPGQYWLKIKLNECEDTDTIIVAENPLPVFTLGKDTGVCISQALSLAAQPAYPGASHLWSTGAISSSILANPPGIYWLRIKDDNGCSYNDTIQVSAVSNPLVNLGSDTSLCQGNILQLSVNLTNAVFVWSTGASGNAINVTQDGIYWVDVTQNGCKIRDSIAVTFNDVPNVDLGADTSFCEGSNVLLDANNPGSQFLWQDNSRNQTFTVNRPGKFFVRVTNQQCSASDTIIISEKLKPRFNLGPDQAICDGFLVLSANSIGGTFSWQDGSSGNSFTVQKPGIYYLDITNECGTSRDSVIVTKGVCQLRIPNAFSPNNDRINDTFKPLGVEDISIYHLQVFNRWGQKIFETKNKLEGWDGKFKGVNAPAGVYVYVMKYSLANNNKVQLAKGTILLTR